MLPLHFGSTRQIGLVWQGCCNMSLQWRQTHKSGAVSADANCLGHHLKLEIVMKRLLILAVMVCGLGAVGSSNADAGWRYRGGGYYGSYGGYYTPYYGGGYYGGGYGYYPYRSYYGGYGYGYSPYRSYYGWGNRGWGGRRGGIYIRW